MSAMNKFQCFVGDLGLKLHNLNTDTLKVYLTNTAPVKLMNATMRSPKRNRGLNTKGEPFKVIYSCRVHGQQAVGWMQTLYVLMGKRRQTRIMEALIGWKTSTYSPRLKGVTKLATCHPDRPLSAKGLCKPCYMAKWHEDHQ